MLDNTDEEVVDYKSGIIIALKTLGICFVCFSFVICAIFSLFPKMSIEISQIFGFSKVEELSYQRVYKQSGKITDLYNVIILEQRQKNYSAELKYIDEMLAKADYDSFCASMDTASLKKVDDKNMIPYSCNVNEYLLSRKIICMYNLKKDSTQFVYDQTSGGSVTELCYATIVDLIFNDKTLSSTDKVAAITQFTEFGTPDMLSKAGDRIAELNSQISSTEDVNTKIILYYCLMRTYRANYFVYDLLGNNSEKEENYNAYNNAKIALNNLVNN